MNVFRNLLLCTDFSSEADHALSYTTRLATQLNAHVHILHVTEPDQAESEAELNERKASIESRFFSDKAIDHTFHLKKGEIEDCIEKTAWSNEIDLIIMGMKGMYGERELIKGSITANLVDKPAAAILGFPGKSQITCVNHICIAVDKLKKVNKSSFVLIRELAKVCNSTVEVFHVQNAEEPSLDEGVEGRLKDFFGDQFNGYHEIYGTDVLKTTDDYVNEHNIDLLVLFHSNASDQSHHRSLTKSWIFRSEIPLLILPGH